MLASLTPCLRHRSATGTPASCSFKIPMICSSVKRLRFMLWSSLGQNELQAGLRPRGKVTGNRAHKELEWGRGGSEEDSHKHQRVATEYTRQTDIDHEGAYDQDEPR